MAMAGLGGFILYMVIANFLGSYLPWALFFSIPIIDIFFHNDIEALFKG